VVEEVFFRLILQGWLENVAADCGDLGGLLLGAPAGSNARASADGNDSWTSESAPITAELVTGDDGETGSLADDSAGDAREAADPAQQRANPYASPWARDLTRTGSPYAEARSSRPRYWPILVSAAAFSLMHLGHGYDFIPLFPLAVGLGYLYQQTHRIVPCIVVHLLLNATSLVVLWLAVTYGAENSSGRAASFVEPSHRAIGRLHVAADDTLAVGDFHAPCCRSHFCSR
jgi:hypothetical protein